MPTIETERLRLRHFAPEDLFAYHRLIYNDPDVMRYLPPGEPIPLERVTLALRNIELHWESFGYGLWAVEESDGRFIGHCGLIRLEDTGMVEVAYALARDRWGQGYATESARASLHYGFETLGLTRVIAIAAPENHASRRVMEKVGMLFERPAHHYGLDVVLYAVDRTAFSLNGSPYAVR